MEPKKKSLALDSRLTGVAKAAFEKLCQKGCDRRILSNLFLLLSAQSPVRLTPRHSIVLSAGDSFEHLLYPVAKDELPRIVKRAEKLLSDIARLRRTRLIRRLIWEGVLTDEDLLGGSLLPPPEGKLCKLLNLPRITHPCFCGLLNLPKLAQKFGPRKRPDYSRRLTYVYKHIHERTKRSHDTEVADILGCLLPDPEHPYSARSLKMWRKRHRLTD